jgi:hypothetical protein
MSDVIAGLLSLVLPCLYVVLQVGITIDRLRRGARVVTGSDHLVDVPPDPKPLSPAAQRALAEAAARRAASD